jgi:hypothetical protein
MRGPVQRCERLSACQALPNIEFNIPALRGVAIAATKVQCDNRVPQNTSTGRGNRTSQLRCAFSLNRADAIHVFEVPFTCEPACPGKPVAPPRQKFRRPELRKHRLTRGQPFPQESLRLLRRRKYSSASNRAIPNRWLSTSSLWRAASRARSVAVSAMKVAASSGPPSSRGSSFRGGLSLPEDTRFRRRPVLVKKPTSNTEYYS